MRNVLPLNTMAVRWDCVRVGIGDNFWGARRTRDFGAADRGSRWFLASCSAGGHRRARAAFQWRAVRVCRRNVGAHQFAQSQAEKRHTATAEI